MLRNVGNYALVMLGLTGPFAGASTPGRTIVYVDQSATGPHDGSSWCQAYVELHVAMGEAVTGDTIRVAGGIYPPDPTGLADPRDATFELLTGVRLEGGYAGCGAQDPDERDLVKYPTILSGDINGDDAPNDSNCCRLHADPGCDDSACAAAVCATNPSCCSSFWGANCTQLAQDVCSALCGGRDENSYHVVSANTIDETAVLDGFTITGGMADGYRPGTRNGGGMYNSGGSPTVVNCTFNGNWASTGGGMYNRDGGHATLIGCTFHHNVADHGGGSFNDHSSPIVNDCTWSRNLAGDTGGGMANWNASHPTLTGCTFSENTTADWGGGMSNRYGSHPTLIGCTFIGNTAHFGGGAANWESDPFLEDCTFFRNSAGITGGSLLNHAGSPTVIRSRFFNNSAGFYGGAMASMNDSGPVVSDCVFNGNSADFGGAIHNDWSRITLTNCTFASNSAVGRALACNSWEQEYPSQVEMNHCIVWDGGDEIWNNDGSTIAVTYSDFQGGLSGQGNIDKLPLFVDPDGPDDILGNEDDNLRLSTRSPAINRGDPGFVPQPGHSDLAGHPRLQGCRVDMGAYESDVAQSSGDFDADENVDLMDYAFLQLCFSSAVGKSDWLDACLCVFDSDDNADVDLDDFADFVRVMNEP